MKANTCNGVYIIFALFEYIVNRTSQFYTQGQKKVHTSFIEQFRDVAGVTSFIEQFRDVRPE